MMVLARQGGNFFQLFSEKLTPFLRLNAFFNIEALFTGEVYLLDA